MNEAIQRTAIAEVCGWKKDYPALAETDDSKILAWRHPNGTGPWGDDYLPNYPEDLDAMHDAEKWLFASKPGYYERGWVQELREALVCAILIPEFVKWLKTRTSEVDPIQCRCQCGTE